MINEIITNSFKHGSNEKNKLKIYFKIESSKKSHVIYIGDNGPGMKLNKKKSNSLGIKLLELLGEQISANVKRLNNDEGVHYKIEIN